MDLEDIERYYRNTDQSIPDVVQALIDKLHDTEIELDQLKYVLEKWDYSTNSCILEMELNELSNEIPPTVLAEVALEVAQHRPDDAGAHKTRAEWRWHILELTKLIIDDEHITKDSEDLDEIVENWISREESLS